MRADVKEAQLKGSEEFLVALRKLSTTINLILKTILTEKSN